MDKTLKIGDLVKCNYDFMGFYEFFEGPETNVYPPFYGIVVSSRLVHDWFGYETLYEVLCTDGYTRSFCIWEIEVVESIA